LSIVLWLIKVLRIRDIKTQIPKSKFQIPRAIQKDEGLRIKLKFTAGFSFLIAT